MGELLKQTLDVTAELPISFYFEKNKSPDKKLLIFLHGYTDSAASFLKRAYDGSGLDYDCLAPNGPFPVPVSTEKGYKEAYSWYFEDHSIGRTIIPKEVTIKILVSLIYKLGLEKHRKTIVGFSQGGFLAPKLAEQLLHVDKIIGIGSDYRKDLYENIKNIKVFGIHGVLDSVVPYQKSFDHYHERAFQGGEFSSIPNMDHKINDSAKAELLRFILK